jgi:hypothetical protein
MHLMNTWRSPFSMPRPKVLLMLFFFLVCLLVLLVGSKQSAAKQEKITVPIEVAH